MRHWTVSLLREGRISREWHVWAETLTVGSHGAAKVRLPLPVEPWALRISELPTAELFEVGEFTLRIADTTHERSRLWERAQIRIESARKQTESTSQARATLPGPFRTAIAALCLAGITQWTAESLSNPDSEPLRVAPSIQVVDAPEIQPQAPFVHVADAPARETLPTSGIHSVSRASAPPSVLAAISTSRSGNGPTLVASPDGHSIGALTSEPYTLGASSPGTSWTISDPVRFSSLDQPPPEPPH
ncbi:MAG: hypothetical protein H6686_10545 [Fibrobacteria bacterium]|nr:hypothetical protein [Fibrobacteria bacterium]